MDDDDLRAKDWVRRQRGGRRVIGESTTSRVDERAWWRPAGNSRGFWKKIEAEDPFVHRPAAPPKRRVVQAAGRFVRLREEEIPKDVEQKKAWSPPPKPKRMAEGTVDPRRAAMERRNEPRSPVTPPPEPGPEQVHTPERGRQAVAPTPDPYRAPEPPPPEPVPPPEPISRTPPKPSGPGKRVSKSGRLRTGASPQRRGRKLVQGGRPPSAGVTPPPPGTVDTSPPPITRFKKEEDEHPFKRRKRSRDDLMRMMERLAEAEDIDKRIAEMKSNNEEIPPNLLEAKERLAREMKQASAPPKPPAPKPTKTRTAPPAKAPTGALSDTRREMLGKKNDKPPPPRRSRDQLAQMMEKLRDQEEQDRQIASAKDRGETWVSNEELFGEDPAWTPPKPKRAATPAPAAAPKPPPAAASRPAPAPPPPSAAPTTPDGVKLPVRPPEDDPRRAVVRNAKRAFATQPEESTEGAPPPRPGGSNSGSLDDLFGGANEGRVRMGRPKKK